MLKRFKTSWIFHGVLVFRQFYSPYYRKNLLRRTIMLTWILCIMASIFGMLGVIYGPFFILAILCMFIEACRLVVDSFRDTAS